MRRLFSEFPGGLKGAAILLARAVIGIAFVLHGWPKMQNPTGWMNSIGMSSVPGFLQALSAFAEFGGGIALILGLLTPIAALGIVFQMLGALFLVHLPHGDPFVAMGGRSYELALVYLAFAALLAVVGPGRYSLDYYLFGRSHTLWHHGGILKGAWR